ncbi:hypothetical protein AB0C38_23055 [Amycolatopsis sp. NPDC048633]|uniref:hypothetical protein n=1 Tax=Amycolatopsis sp. NPDC048633 TaxID=3157095 RepID=UPI0033F02E20
MTAVAGMNFSVDSWDPGYGSSMEAEELARSGAEVELDVEVPAEEWAPIDPSPVSPPEAVLFVDGVRRIDARVWIDDAAGMNSASIGLCASYAAGVVCCCEGRAHVVANDVRRGLFTVASEAAGISTSAGLYEAFRATAKDDKPLAVVLSSALQEQLAETELKTAMDAREAISGHVRSDLLVVDGPLSGRTHLPRAVGFIKSHQTTYLPGELNAMVGRLDPHQRTPVFLMGTTWVRHSWYLRLPSVGGPPWSGVVRVEAAPHLGRDEVAGLANLTQSLLGRFASVEYKDSRAPQNLYPIAGLERDLRHRLGDQQFVYRALRVAAAR